MTKHEKEKKLLKEMRQAQKHRELARFYNLNSILGNDWCIFYFLIGGRMTGKSYSVTDYICNRKIKLGDQCKNYWMRLSETSTKALLSNKAHALVDPDLCRKYNLELTTKASQVFNHGEPFMEVFPLTMAAKAKGMALYDKDFKGEINIVLDEFIYDKKAEKRPSIDILYAFTQMCETIARTTKNKIKVFLCANAVSEASSILASAFNFLPEKFGRFYLKRKRCIIDNIEPTEEYLKDREGSIADILSGDDDANYTNVIKRDVALIYKGRLNRPYATIKFGKDCGDWFTMWSTDKGTVIRRWNKEQLPKETDFAMRPYLDSYYSRERMQNILDIYDARGFLFSDLTTQARFTEYLSNLRKT